MDIVAVEKGGKDWVKVAGMSYMRSTRLVIRPRLDATAPIRLRPSRAGASVTRNTGWATTGPNLRHTLAYSRQYVFTDREVGRGIVNPFNDTVEWMLHQTV